MFDLVSKDQSRSKLRVTTSLSRFRRDDEGSFVIFSLFIFILMIIIGGLAIDLMRYENLRTTMQNTIDRAVLAAADLNQDVDPKVVVADYLDKAGMENLPYEVFVDDKKVGSDVVDRTVYVSSTVVMDTYFMKMIGTPELPVPVATKANEQINDIEISLVLDVSGSMGWGTKLPEMKDAASDFIDEVMLNTEPGRVSMSIVPYATQVNPGADLASKFNITTEHTYSHCIEFETEDFNTTEMKPGVLRQRFAHFDPFSNEDEGRVLVEDGGNWTPHWSCRTEDAFEITPWSISPSTLKTQINALTAQGYTSIDVGTKWGTALLDPSTATVVDGLVGDGVLNNKLSGRPSAYADPNDDTQAEVLKFMIVMTDGVTTTEWKLDEDYRTGPSGFWRDPDSGRYSFAHQEVGDEDGDGISNEAFWLLDGHDEDYASHFAAEIYDVDEDGDVAEEDDRNAYELDWTEVFASMSVRDYAHSAFREQTGSNQDYKDARNDTRANLAAGPKVTRLHAICKQARDAGIVIFSIGFEVTDDSALVMQQCASSPNHFFRVDSEKFDIAYAFDAIANTINQLKLTQ
ncbi:MAG: Tad domain-containing protein [Pseudomonadota bacterium]